MKYSFRWFGPNDPTSLDQIRQVGANNIVTSLADIKYGEKWSNQAIQKRKKVIEKVKNKNFLKLKWSVVESLPVHNDIKIRSGKYQYYIEQYKDSLQNLAKNNINKNDIGREEFIKKVWEWKTESGGIILEQLKKLGCSCDWSRSRFTMDSEMSKAVAKVFVTLYNNKLIYKNKKLVNWDTELKTAISDLEVVQNEVQSQLFYIK